MENIIIYAVIAYSLYIASYFLKKDTPIQDEIDRNRFKSIWGLL